ncbi:sensor histidine kinase, partial [Poseidonibacter antarcticus]|uniref:sensor histidine kinase n=1 Tax=Poseidonibacter antarcticus TaxID=2478538 RepID=UPI0013CF123E
MIKIILIILLHFTMYASNTLIITEDEDLVDASPYTFYIQDSNLELNESDILTKKDLKIPSQNGHLGNIQGPIWSKVTLQNESNKYRHFIIYNQLPGTNYIDVFLFKKNKLIKTHLLGDMRSLENREMNNRFSAFKLILAPQEKITVISKIDNYSILNIGWTIEDNIKFIENESKFLVIFGLVGGIFFLFIILSFILYSFYKKIPYLIIALYLINTFYYQFSIQGIVHTLDMGINLNFNTLVSWTGAPVGAILLLFFAYYFFDMKMKYKKTSYILKFLIIINTILLFGFLYSSYIDENYFLITTLLTGPAYVLSIIFLMIIGLFMNEIGSKYYLLGQSIMLIAVVINALAITNIIDFHNSYRYIITISVLLDVVLLFIAQSLKTFKSIREQANAKRMLIEQSRFSSMGQAIGHIIHQWKHPLTLLGTSVMLLETILKHDKNNVILQLEKELPTISDSIEHMKKTVTELSSFYLGNVEKISFLPLEITSNVVKLLGAKIILKNVKIKIHIPKTMTIHNYEHIFSNIIIILIDNSLDAFSNKENNTITIKLELINDK